MSEALNCTPSELSTYLRAVAVGCLPTCCLDTGQSVPSKLTHIASKSYRNGKRTVSFRGFPSLETLEHSTEYRGEALRTSLQVDSHARTSALPEKARASKASAVDSGERWQGWFAKFDPALSLWRTRQCSLFGALDECSVTWPKWGMMRNGVASTLPTLVRRTQEKEYSSLVATPTTKGNQHCPSMDKWPSCVKWTRFLSHLANGGLMPTPTTSDAKGASAKRFYGSQSYKGNLREFLRDGILDGQYPNPSVSEWMMGWPSGWSELVPLEMDKFQSWQQQHGESLRKAFEPYGPL